MAAMTDSCSATMKIPWSSSDYERRQSPRPCTSSSEEPTAPLLLPSNETGTCLNGPCRPDHSKMFAYCPEAYVDQLDPYLAAMSMMEYTNEFNFAPQVSDTLLPITTTPVSDCSLDYFPDAGPADFSFRTPSITPSTFVNPCAGLDAYDIDALIASSVPAALDTVPSFNTTTLSNEPLPLDAVSDLHATGAYDASTAFDESITVNASTGLNTPTDFNQPTSFDLSPNFNACIPFDASMNFNTSIASNTTTAFIGPTTSAISQAPDLAVHPDLVLPSNQPMPPGTQSPQICSTRSIASKKHSPPPNRQNCTSSKMLHFEDGWDEYWIRSNIESVPQESITAEVRQTNSIYPNANASQSEDQYKGRRWSFERECNRIGWALAVLNPTIEGKRSLIQKAVTAWRNASSDRKLHSRNHRKRRARPQEYLLERRSGKSQYQQCTASQIPVQKHADHSLANASSTRFTKRAGSQISNSSEL